MNDVAVDVLAMARVGHDRRGRHATGGTTCVDDIALTLTMTASAFPTCYRLTVITNQSVYTCQTTATGSCTIASGSDSYSDATTIDLEIEKTCGTTQLEDVAYSVVGHL